MSTTDQLIDSFATMLKDHGVPIRAEDNAMRLRVFEEKLPKRMPQSFESFLSRYSFPAFDVHGITLFEWDSDKQIHHGSVSAQEYLVRVAYPSGIRRQAVPIRATLIFASFSIISLKTVRIEFCR
jgi:hypothetical protein